MILMPIKYRNASQCLPCFYSNSHVHRGRFRRRDSANCSSTKDIEVDESFSLDSNQTNQRSACRVEASQYLLAESMSPLLPRVSWSLDWIGSG